MVKRLEVPAAPSGVLVDELRTLGTDRAASGGGSCSTAEDSGSGCRTWFILRNSETIPGVVAQFHEESTVLRSALNSALMRVIVPKCAPVRAVMPLSSERLLRTTRKHRRREEGFSAKTWSWRMSSVPHGLEIADHHRRKLPVVRNPCKLSSSTVLSWVTFLALM